MSAPQVPPAGAPASTSAGTAGLVSVPSEIVRLPQELAARLLQTPRTVFLTGTVTGQAPDGALQVRSQLGEIALRAGTNVPPDRQVSLQIPPLSGKAAALLPAQLARSPIPVSLLLPRPTAAQAAGQAPAGPIPAGANSGTQSPPAPAQALPSAQTGPATQSPAPAPAITTGGPAPAGPSPAGPSPAAPALPGSVSAAGGMAPQTTAASNQALPGGSPAAAPPQTAGATTTPAGVPASPAPTAQATAPSGQPAGAAPQLGRPALSPQVVTQAANPPATPTPGQAPLSQAPQGQAPTTPAPQGPPAQAPAPSTANPASPSPAASAVAVEGGGRVGEIARPAPPPQPVAPGLGADDALPVESARRVPALRQAVSILSAADPALAAQFVRSVVPQGNTQLAATLLFFLSATRGGDIRGWVGDRVASRLEDAGRADMLPRLSAELAGTTRPAPDPATGEWRTQTIPLYQDGDIGGLTMHVRAAGDEDGSADDTDEDGQRFLIDMDLSRMGPLQLDGLVRDRRLDVTIRSQAAFPESMRQDMRTLFNDASETVGLHGGLTFQAGGHDWVTIANARGSA